MVRTNTYKGNIEPKTFVCKGTFAGVPCRNDCEIRIPGLYVLARKPKCVMFRESDTETLWIQTDGGDE